MTQVREPVVAGSFYPADAAELKDMLRSMLSEVSIGPGPAPKALIVPHAGLVYSGRVAASAYAQLLPHRSRYRRVLLLGPCHHVALGGLADSGADAFASPLGTIRVDREALDTCSHPALVRSAAAHRLEHSLEVQLPFLQWVLDDFALLPLAVGSATGQEVREVIEAFWGGPETLVVVSTDLSHFLDYERARLRDRATCRLIEAMDFEHIGHADACGATPLRGLLLAACRRGLNISTLDLRNSGDTAGNGDRVVGYGSWMLREQKSCEQAA